MKLYLVYSYNEITSIWDSKEKAEKESKKLRENGVECISIVTEKLNFTEAWENELNSR